MSTAAVIMMLVAMTVLWGGLAIAVWNIVRRSGTGPDTASRDL